MIKLMNNRRGALAALALAGLATGTGVALGAHGTSAHTRTTHVRTTHARTHSLDSKLAHIKLFAPEDGDHAGIGSRGWLVDLEAEFKLPIEQTGFDPTQGTDGLQLTGPGLHNNAAPFPGSFSMGQDDRFKGLIVLVATNQAGAGKNVANLFNLTGVTNRTADETEIWDTWIVGAPVFGRNVNSTVYVAIAADKNGNGILDDAPATVPDANGDGKVDESDLRAFGVASNIESADFFIRD